MTKRRGRPYVEAFPALSLRLTGKAYDRGTRIVQWVTERGTPVGSAQILELTETDFCFRYRFSGVPNVAAADGRMAVAITRRRLNPDRVLAEFNCPICYSEVDLMYFARGRWACRVCHGLGHLLHRCSPFHKQMLKNDALLRPKLIFEDLGAETSWLESSEHAFSKLPQELRFRIVGRWLSCDEKASDGPDMVGWKNGDPGGFAAFERPETEGPLVPLEFNRLTQRLPLVDYR